MDSQEETQNVSGGFFDRDSVFQKKLWNKPEQDFEQKNQITSKLAEGVFHKITQKLLKTKKRYYLLDDKNLYMLKGEKEAQISGCICIINAYLQRFEDEDAAHFDQNLQGKCYRLIIKKDLIDLTIFTLEKEVYTKWVSILTLKCVLNNISLDFQVEKQIGNGSFAQVFLATKLKTAQKFAIKVFNKQFIRSKDKGPQSVINEIQIMRTLDHKYCIQLYEVYQSKNSVYLILELLQGGQLEGVLQKLDEIEEKRTRAIVANILQALAYIHSRNICHRDLKPENILFRTKDPNSECVIADFGLSMNFNEQKVLFKRCGTPGFVAPEILRYKDGDQFYDCKCDVFSTGVIFYTFLTGEVPFNATNLKKLLDLNRSCQINFQHQEFKTCRDETIKLLKGMLDVQAANRFTAKECLQQAYFKLEDNMLQQKTSAQKLTLIMSEFKKNLGHSCEVIESQDHIGSLALYTGVMNSGFKGTLRTLDNVGSNNSLYGSMDRVSIGNSTPKNYIPSQFKDEVEGSPKSIFSSHLNPQSFPVKLKQGKSNNDKNLMKNAIKNNYIKKQIDQEKKAEEDYQQKSISEDQESELGNVAQFNDGESSPAESNMQHTQNNFLNDGASQNQNTVLNNLLSQSAPNPKPQGFSEYILQK